MRGAGAGLEQGAFEHTLGVCANAGASIPNNSSIVNRELISQFPPAFAQCLYLSYAGYLSSGRHALLHPRYVLQGMIWRRPIVEEACIAQGRYTGVARGNTSGERSEMVA